jgi:hypothetical protein
MTGPEMIAALFRKIRKGQISQSEANQFANDFRVAWQQQYQIIEVTVGLIERAMSLAEIHQLRGYDSVHLAAALVVQEVDKQTFFNRLKEIRFFGKIGFLEMCQPIKLNSLIVLKTIYYFVTH